MNFVLLVLCSIFPLVLTQRASSNAQQICRNNRNAGLFAHEEYCDYYYECDGNGEAIVQSCPNGLAFAGSKRGLIQNCDYPHRVGCPDGQRVMGQQPITSENCHWQYGLFPHVTSCTRFWHCWNGTAIIQQCPFSLLYNDALSICDYPQQVKDCMAHPICKETPNGLVPIEKSCVRYWNCIQGYPRISACPAGLAVNPSTLKCELASTVPGCEPPPSTRTSSSSNSDDEEENEQPPSTSNGSSGSQSNDNGNRPQSTSNSRPQSNGGSSNSNSNQFRSNQGVRLVG